MLNPYSSKSDVWESDSQSFVDVDESSYLPLPHKNIKITSKQKRLADTTSAFGRIAKGSRLSRRQTPIGARQDPTPPDQDKPTTKTSSSSVGAIIVIPETPQVLSVITRQLKYLLITPK
jgi:hypothetical protein